MQEGSSDRVVHLERALAQQSVIEQAKGIIAGRYGLSLDEGFDVLRRAARFQRIKVRDLAGEVVAYESTPDVIVAVLPLEGTILREKQGGSPSTDEALRQAAVGRYDILDTPQDGAFDRITKLAVRLFDVPISIVSIVDHDRIWFKSAEGVDATEVAREPGLCASAILAYEPWVVTNARVDPRTLSNPLVAGDLGLQFYAGVPLTTHDGFNLGVFCIIDSEPRELSGDELGTLETLAGVIVDELEIRRAALTLLPRSA